MVPALLLVVAGLLLVGQVVRTGKGAGASEACAAPRGAQRAPAAHWVYCPAGATRDAPVVLALHGWSSSADDWSYARPIANQLGWCMVAWDAPGTRYSPDPDEWPDAPWDLSAFADAAVDLLDHLGHEKALVMGVSWGAYIATRIASRHPDRVLGIVAVGVGQDDPPLQIPPEAMEEMRARIALIEAGDESAWAQEQANHDAAFYPGSRNKVDYTWSKDTRSFRLPASMVQLDSVMGVDFRPELSRVRASGPAALPPALFVLGDSDRLHSVESVHRLASSYGPQASVVLYAATGHIVQHERRARFHADVVSWVQRRAL